MLKIKFQKTKDSETNKLYLFLGFEGGDADTDHPEFISFEGVSYLNYKDNLDKIEDIVKKYKTLKNILDVNHKNYCDDYDDVKNTYGEEMANLFDNSPNDPQSDYSTKCSLDTIKLIAYDEFCNKYESYL